MIQMDSDVVIDIARGFPPAMEWLLTVDASEELAISGFTAMEILQGNRNAGEQRRSTRTLSRFTILWLTPIESEGALAIFTKYRLSHGAGILDTIIGYTAITHNLPLMTFNTKHFGYLPGIRVPQPYNRA